jgi:dCMP deaminase
MKTKEKNGQLIRFAVRCAITGKAIRNREGLPVQVMAYTPKAAKHQAKGMHGRPGDRRGRSMIARWDGHHLGMALFNAAMSKDPATRVGSVIVGPDREIRSTGFNGLPRGIHDTAERLNDRDTKLRLVVHAEMNAILNAARIGVSTRDCTLYLAATDDTGMVWGGPPCTRCTVEIIQAGISEIVSYPRKTAPSRWAEDLEFAQQLLREAGVGYRELSP